MMPATKTQTDKIGGVSSDAVEEATGRSWKQWLSALDKRGCKDKGHKQIVAAVGEIDSSVSNWWRQMVTVGYEQARGLRARHEKPDGFEISVSRTVSVPVSKAYRAWSDSRTRKKWLDEAVKVRTSTKDKTIRLDWPDGATRINIYFTVKGAAKCQVTVQHVKLPTAKQAEKAKAAWRARLDGLKRFLETNV